jgi:hypothetical protein
VKRHLDDITCDICGAQSGPMEGTSEKARAWGTATLWHPPDAVPMFALRLTQCDACPVCMAGLATIDAEATAKRQAFVELRRNVNVRGEAES